MRARVGSGRWGLVIGALLAAGCQSENLITSVPDLSVGVEQLNFGRVRTGSSAKQAVPVANFGRVSLALWARVEDDPAAPGGAAAFTIDSVPERLVSQADLGVVFVPPALGDFRARLIIESDDPDPADRLKEVALVGRGADSRVRVVAACEPPCTEFTASVEPPAIDYGTRLPLRRGGEGVLVEPAWPTVTVLNEGELPVTLRGAELRGDPGFSARESTNAAGLVVGPGESHTVHVAFDPPGGVARNFEGQLVLATDERGAPEFVVALRGALAPNRPPSVCAGIVEVHQPNGAVSYPRDGSGAIAFGGKVQVQPGEKGLVLLSAFSDHFVPGLHPLEAERGDPAACTTDLEDGREALRYAWSVIARPAESAAEVIDPLSPEPRFRPDAIGHYALRLTVTDPWGESGSADVEFDALPVRDLVAQLSWERQPGVDLDVHLVKPGPCGEKADCLFDRRGDVSGYLAARNDGVYDWGLPGLNYDDPRLDFDDQGDGALIEIANLNYPQNDPACRTSRCIYDVYVHYFKDWRASSLTAPRCPDRPCLAGSTCGCPKTGAGIDAVCVSERCVQPVRATVKLYVQSGPGQSTPALVVPLAGEDFTLPSPCVLWHVARISWPSLEDLQRNPRAAAVVIDVGAPQQRSLAFYGSLAPKSFSCAPNTPAGTPAEDVTFLPGTVPLYP